MLFSFENFTKEQSVACRVGQTKKLPLDLKGITANRLPGLAGGISTYLHLGELLEACYLARVAAAPGGSPQNRPRAWRPLYR